MLDKMFESLFRDEPIAEAIAKISKLASEFQTRMESRQMVQDRGAYLYGYPDRIGN